MSDPTTPSDPSPSTATAAIPTSAAADPNPTDAATAARQAREARKARILSKGSDRLARITNTGRGEGGSGYLNASTPLGPSRPSSAVSPAPDQDPLEIDVSTLPTIASDSVQRGELAAGNPFVSPSDAAFNSGPPELGSGNPLEALMAMLQGQTTSGGASGPGAQAQRGAVPPGMEGLPPQLAALLQGSLNSAGPNPAGGTTPLDPAQPASRASPPLATRLFTALQPVLLLLLSLHFARTSLLPAPDAQYVSAPPASDALARFAHLAYHPPVPASWPAALPHIYPFLLLETVLQSCRILLPAASPAPPSLLASLLPLLPVPALRTPLLLAGKYLSLLDTLVTHLSIVVFGFGMLVVWAGWGGQSVGQVAGVLRDEL